MYVWLSFYFEPRTPSGSSSRHEVQGSWGLNQQFQDLEEELVALKEELSTLARQLPDPQHNVFHKKRFRQWKIWIFSMYSYVICK